MSSQRLRSCRFREACCPLAITLIRVLISVSVLVEKAHFCGSEGLKDLINSRSTLGVAGGSVQFDFRVCGPLELYNMFLCPALLHMSGS